MIITFWQRIARVIGFQKMFGLFGLNHRILDVWYLPCDRQGTDGRKVENKATFWSTKNRKIPMILSLHLFSVNWYICFLSYEIKHSLHAKMNGKFYIQSEHFRNQEFSVAKNVWNWYQNEPNTLFINSLTQIFLLFLSLFNKPTISLLRKLSSQFVISFLFQTKCIRPFCSVCSFFLVWSKTRVGEEDGELG